MANITTKDPRLITFQTLRITVGWLGILLPLAMVGGNFLFAQCTVLQTSISHYYYTVTGNLFVGILCAVALFLVAYKGYNQWDHRATSFAGVCAFAIAMFPTDIDTLAGQGAGAGCLYIHLPPNGVRNAVHYAGAALFFLTLAFISLFQFTKSRGQLTRRKRLRNSLYRSCGIVIVLSTALIGLYGRWWKQVPWIAAYKPVFWLEWIALTAFGITWLVKGNLFLTDKE